MARSLKKTDLNPLYTVQAPEAEALFMSIGDGAIVTNEKAMISRINNVALSILGYKESELLNKWFPLAIIAEDEDGEILNSIERPLGQAFLTGKSISSRTYYRRKDGSRVPVSLTVSPVMVGTKPVGAIEVFRDISQEVALERAKDEFVAIASHQLRTPATAVKQYVGLLLEGYAEPLTDNQRFFLEQAYESNERQLNIVQEILKITQLDLEKVVLKQGDYDIWKIARDSATGLKGSFDKKHQKIVINLPTKPLVLNVDCEQIQAVIENLLENASNYSWENKKIVLAGRTTQKSVIIDVTDEGVGIDTQDIPKLFQKFSRIPNPLSIDVGGTGLGLYWSAKIIEMHGGSIKVKSILDKGSTFTVTIPKTS